MTGGLTLVLLSWFWRTEPGLTLSGWFQGDLPTYLCYGRMALESPTTLSYASPHDIRPDPPALLVHLPISLIGWLLSLGVPPGWIGHALRLLFGPLMYVGLGLLLRHVFRPGPWFWCAFTLVGAGGGFAWVGAVLEVSPGLDAAAWRAAVRALESPYYWWFLDLFRNLTYPLELIYHTILLGQLWALSSRRYAGSSFFHALACLSNPFIGIQSTGVQLATLTLASVRPPRPTLRVLALSTIVAAVFVIYYGVLLPTDPAIRSLQTQHQHELSASLPAASLLVGYGPALLAPLTLLDGSFRRLAFRRFSLVPLFVLGAWTLILTQNSRFLGPDHSLQPMHFSRGWLQVALWPIVLAWLQHRTRAPVPPRALAAALIALVLLTLPDNLLFVEDMYAIPPHRSSLRWDATYAEVHELLEREPPRRVLVDDWTLSRQICGLHAAHRVAIGTHHTTPHFSERQAELHAFRRDPDHQGPMLRWADLMIVRTSDGPWLRSARANERWREVLCNRVWCVFEKVTRPQHTGASRP